LKSNHEDDPESHEGRRQSRREKANADDALTAKCQ
jgi:hypothetical protein